MAKRKKKTEPDTEPVPSSQSDRAQRLQAVVRQLNKKKKVLRAANEVSLLLEGETPLGTGSLLFDFKVLHGGLFPGRIYEFFGDESSGKTSLTLLVAAEAQKQGKVALFVDYENAFSAEHAEKIGVDTSQLLVCQPDSAEEGIEVMIAALEARIVDVIIVDSVSAMVPKSDTERTVEQGAQVGTRAKLLSEQLPKLVKLCEQTRAIMLWINQIRFKIGVMFGNPEVTSGGNALKFFASGRFRVRSKGWLKHGEVIVGQNIKVHSEKLKTGVPRRECLIPYYYESGVDRLAEIIQLLPEYPECELVKNGAWYRYKDTAVVQGDGGLRELLMENEDARAALEQRIAICIQARHEGRDISADELPPLDLS